MTGMNLFCAHRLDDLVVSLSNELEPRLHDLESLFCPIDIIVPNSAVEEYLAQEIARQLGVTPNLRFHRLRRFLAEHLTAEDSNGMRPIILGKEALQHILLDLLTKLDSQGALADCEPVVNYLRPPNVLDTTARERRLHQLSGELARIFIEYSFSRSAPVNGTTLDWTPFLATWNDDAADSTTTDSCQHGPSIERWQRAIWRQVFGAGGVLAELNSARAREQKPPYKTLTQVFTDYQRAQTAGRAPALPATIYLVGFPHIARVFVEAISLMGRATNVRIFSLTPSSAGIEKLRTSTPDTARLAHPLLRLWASAGVEHERAWADIGVAPHISGGAPVPVEKPAHLLQALQNDIIRGDAEPKPAGKVEEAAPQSIRFMECHSIAREVEAVADQIWHLLENSRRVHTPPKHPATQIPQEALHSDKIPLEALRPDEIAVVIAGRDQREYQTHIEQVFAGFHGLSRSYVGLPPATASRALDAVGLLLQLPFGRFRRSELLRLLVHPNLRGHLGPSPAEEWAGWAERLGILFGADRAEQAHTYLNDPTVIGEGDAQEEYHWDLYNWEQGLRRLALGQCLSGALSGIDATFKVDQVEYIPLETADSAAGEVARFSAMASSLMADARWLRDGDNPPGEPALRSVQQWAQLVEEYLQTYLRVTLPAAGDHVNQRKEDGYYLKAARNIIRRIGTDCPTDSAVSYRIFYEIAREALDDLQQAGPQSLHSGVIVSTCLELRGIPFKHVFVVGLGAGQFPNPDYNNPLDLRVQDPQPGDLAPSDRDRYAFLETLLAARQSLTLSWVAREATTGESLNASSVVNELRWVLEDRFGIAPPNDKAADPLTTRHKLRRFHPDYTAHDFPVNGSKLLPWGQTIHPLARHEACLYQARRNNQLGATTLKDIRNLSARLEQWPRLRAALRLMPLPSELLAEAGAESAHLAAPSGVDTPPGTMQIRGGHDLSQPDLPPEPKRVRLSLYQLINFLESPLQGAAKIQLGLRDDEDDLFAEERELLTTTSLHQTILLTRLGTQEALKGASKDDFGSAYDKLFLPRENIHNHLPSAYFLTQCRKQHLSMMETWWDNFATFGVELPLRAIGLGDGNDHDTIRLPAIHFELTPQQHGVAEPTRVEIAGLTKLLVPKSSENNEGDQRPKTYSLFDLKSEKSPTDKAILKGYINWAAILATHPDALDMSDDSESPKLIINSLYKYAPKTVASAMFPLRSELLFRDSQDARKYLENLSATILRQHHDYLMPLDYILKVKKDVAKGLNFNAIGPDHLQQWLDGKLEDPHGYISSKFGPIKDINRFEALDSNVKEAITERFPFWFRLNN